jgi:hypothetical protein
MIGVRDSVADGFGALAGLHAYDFAGFEAGTTACPRRWRRRLPSPHNNCGQAFNSDLSNSDISIPGTRIHLWIKVDGYNPYDAQLLCKEYTHICVCFLYFCY